MTRTYFQEMYSEAMTYVYFKLFTPELRQMKVVLVNKFVYYKYVSKNNRNTTIAQNLHVSQNNRNTTIA